MTERILIIDDESYTRDFLQEILEDEGYEVFTASDADEAIEEAKARSFNIIFLDVLIPMVNGVSILKDLRKVSPGVPVIIITAYGGHELVKKAIAEGVEGCIYKPIDTDGILNVINKHGKRSNHA